MRKGRARWRTCEGTTYVVVRKGPCASCPCASCLGPWVVRKVGRYMRLGESPEMPRTAPVQAMGDGCYGGASLCPGLSASLTGGPRSNQHGFCPCAWGRTPRTHPRSPLIPAQRAFPGSPPSLARYFPCCPFVPPQKRKRENGSRGPVPTVRRRDAMQFVRPDRDSSGPIWLR
jgi:hypothetical protein